MKNICLCLLIVLVLLFSTSCGLLQTASVNPPSADDSSENTQVVKETISNEEDAKAKKIINEYFTALYTKASVDYYNDYSGAGIIPGHIRGFIAEKTIKEGDGNPEIGIHLPRFISINGLTIVEYNLETISENNGGEDPNIVADFISKNGDIFLYYTKIYCKAKVIPDEVFSELYTRNSDNTYSKTKEIKEEDIDYMRVELRYDVELVKSDIGLSILRAVESNIKSNMKNRLFVFNNDNITRLPYLNLSKNENGSYKNPSDGEIYETEKAVIKEFFSKFTELDRERMNLLKYRWKQGLKSVTEFLDSIGITTGEGGVKLIELDNDYDSKYPINSFPLRNNMERIKEIKNFEVTPHPAYSEKIKLYYVKFDATVQRTNGITDEFFTYRYDYIVSLSKTEDSVFIEKIKLNEYFTFTK